MEPAPPLKEEAFTFTATVEGALARITEAHRCEVVELQRQLDALRPNGAAGATQSRGFFVDPSKSVDKGLGRSASMLSCSASCAGGQSQTALSGNEAPQAAPERSFRQEGTQSIALVEGACETIEATFVPILPGSVGAPEAPADKPSKLENGWTKHLKEPKDEKADAPKRRSSEDKKEKADGPKRKGSEDADAKPGKHSVASSVAASVCDVAEPPDHAKWQWMHRTGWKDYDEHSSKKIEEAFQRGDPKARLKAGKRNNNPMEIFFTDMIQYDALSGNSREVQRVGPNRWWQRLRRNFRTYYRAWETGRPRKESLETYRARKRQLQERRVQSVESGKTTEDFYHKDGCFASVAKNKTFQAGATFLVALNALWMAIELDCNYEYDSEGNHRSKIEYEIVEHAFCSLFTLEILIRFLAFERKRSCLSDKWFRFDGTLVFLMILELWLVPLGTAVVHPGQKDSSALGDLAILRMARLLRLTRMIRLLRSVPDLITLLRGLTTSIRPVSISCLLLVILLYVFGIVFRSQVEPLSYLERTYFPSMIDAMLNLLLHGTFLDNVAVVTREVRTEGGAFLMISFFLCIFLTSFTVLNMLIGVVCEMVSVVKQAENDRIAKSTLKAQLYDILQVYDADGSGTLIRSEFELFMGNVEVMQVLTVFDVDVKGLMTLTEMMFTDTSSKGADEEISLTFDEIMDLAVRLKGDNASRVEDIVQLRQFTKVRLEVLEDHLVHGQQTLRGLIARLEEHLGNVELVPTTPIMPMPISSEHPTRVR